MPTRPKASPAPRPQNGVPGASVSRARVARKDVKIGELTTITAPDGSIIDRVAALLVKELRLDPADIDDERVRVALRDDPAAFLDGWFEREGRRISSAPQRRTALPEIGDSLATIVRAVAESRDIYLGWKGAEQKSADGRHDLPRDPPLATRARRVTDDERVQFMAVLEESAVLFHQGQMQAALDLVCSQAQRLDSRFVALHFPRAPRSSAGRTRRARSAPVGKDVGGRELVRQQLASLAPERDTTGPRAVTVPRIAARLSCWAGAFGDDDVGRAVPAKVRERIVFERYGAALKRARRKKRDELE